ncbi:MAG TPA: hypothetical protein VGK75_09460 [Casimicrobiaceae bacterium]|jgi:hypothetical protein
MSIVHSATCVFCGRPAKLASASEPGIRSYSCPGCGDYRCSSTLEAELKAQGRPDNWIAISHVVRTRNPALITTQYFSDFLRNAVEPPPMTAVDNVIMWIGNNTNFGTDVTPSIPELATRIGTSEDALDLVIEYARSQQWLEFNKTLAGVSQFQLTIPGWGRLRELRTSSMESRVAFMAMKFNEAELNDLYQAHFKEAVKQTGFDLETVEVAQPAGLIDDHIRVKIRRSRFMIADVTHGNNGAYWEAGFAEGLGLPVIYTCSTKVMGDKAHPHHPHFDTNHHLTVEWDSEKPAAACTKLKATIRATLPHVAKLVDD